MLTKRTNILFEEDLWQKLVMLSQTRNLSVGELIRKAIEKQYSDDVIKDQRRAAIESTLEGRLISKTKIDYKELINFGRKY